MVGLRVGATAPEAAILPPKAPPQAGRVDRQVTLHENRAARTCAVTTRPAIDAAGGMSGPLLVEDDTATIYVPPGWSALGDASGNLILQRTGESA